MTAELVHDEDWLRRAWLAANPGVTPTPWDGPVRPLRRLTLVPPPPPPSEQLSLALPPVAQPINLAQYRRTRHLDPEGA